jgi:hypothetical protein
MQTHAHSTRAFVLSNTNSTHRQSEVKAIGQISVSAHLQLQLVASISLSLCIGFICGGVSANARWEAAAGFDVGLTTTADADMPGRGLDADGVGCREYTFESKLTNYAEYPKSDGVCQFGATLEQVARHCHALGPYSGYQCAFVAAPGYRLSK